MIHCQNSLTNKTNIIFFNADPARVHEPSGCGYSVLHGRRARAERTCSRAPVRHRPLYSSLQQRRHHGGSARRRLLDLLATVVAHNARIAFAAPLPLPSTSSYRVCAGRETPTYRGDARGIGTPLSGSAPLHRLQMYARALTSAASTVIHAITHTLP